MPQKARIAFSYRMVYRDNKCIGQELIIGGEPFVVFLDQNELPGLRCGGPIVPPFGVQYEYRAETEGEFLMDIVGLVESDAAKDGE